ncbi:hydroxysqualene dehydroxylase HpnE [Paludisphaera mucosa]|uniref:Hydroxysqualene dehydroxylase HpnE n=1 Tax=Paludisphaera mucosa TaxID=3030827 RepID=A0ABT6FCW8_9BACT|nr:hydroxysqualene dehydroxylase HpnE [Paludisphaera mucosa]MDG3005200.1 hydroxysqualene dehydroxylase HpnE [Paludisphaera mucosa]
MMRNPPPPPHLVIVGGGLAGLATAATLVDRGLRITLLESRPRLGGRASSFTDPVTGELVDNCQHVSMVCCTNLDDFCRRVGIAGLFRREPTITFLGPDGRTSTLRAGFGPAPFHLGGSFLRAKYLGWGDKMRVAYGLARLALDRDAGGGDRRDESFADWLWRHGQNVRTIHLFWATVLVSALNERLDQMDVGLARQVFVDGFLMNREGFQMEVPSAPLGELYGARLETWLRDRGVDVRLTTGVRSIDADEDGSTVRGVTLRNGETIDADMVVAAVPFDRVGGLLDPAIRGRVPAIEGLGRLESSPITGVHLWFDRPVCPLDHAVAPGRFLQWVFNHTALQGRSPKGGGQYLQVVISASYDLAWMSKEMIRDAVLADLAEMWPAAEDANLVRWWVVTEHGATFAPRPGVAALRPPQRTPVDGLFLAGDWTDTGWPATMEGAVRSGYLAAQGILEDLDRPARLLRPDLTPDRLAGRLLTPQADSGGLRFAPDFEEVSPEPAGG